MERSSMENVIFLENTRLIYSGISTLYELWKKEYPHLQSDLEVRESVKNVVDKQWDACFPVAATKHDSSEKAIRYQNPLHMFFRFLLGELSERMNDMHNREQSCKDETVRMISLYHTAVLLESSAQKENYSELFETLCDSMRDIMNCKVCYLLYSQRDQTELLSMSSFPEDMVFSQLRQSHFEEIRTSIERSRSKKRIREDSSSIRFSFADTVFVPNAIGEQPVAVIVLDYPRYPKNDWKGEWIYIVCHYSCKDDIKEAEMLTSSRNLLFLRHNILNQCKQKMHILLMGQRSYQYVKPLNGADSISILHLTDLHLQQSNKQQSVDFVTHFRAEAPIDLLVITGDVVQGSSSAGVLEANYVIADEFVRRLAVKIWKKPNGYVRSDWQKRIVVIPGNHDYASMNELQALSVPGAKRSTGGGYPARNEGGPMVKFAYYINFVCHLLGLDMDTLIENDLNELRCYRNLDLTIYALNTVSQTGPLRTNKVLFNADVIERFAKTADAQNQFRLLLCHHSPCYEPDYLMDRYWFNSKATADRQKEWVTTFRQLLEDIWKNAMSDHPVMQERIKESLITLKAEIVNEAGLDENHPEKNDLLWDVTRTLIAISSPPFYSEQIAALRNSVKSDYEMTERDRKLLKENYRKLLREINYCLALGGHTHSLAKGGKDIPVGVDFSAVSIDEIPYVEGDLMFKSDSTSYGIITINKAQRSIRCKWFENALSDHLKSKKMRCDKEWTY